MVIDAVCEPLFAHCDEGQRGPCRPDWSGWGRYCGHYEHMHDRSKLGIVEPGVRWMPWSFRRLRPHRRGKRCRRW